MPAINSTWVPEAGTDAHTHTLAPVQWNGVLNICQNSYYCHHTSQVGDKGLGCLDSLSQLRWCKLMGLWMLTDAGVSLFIRSVPSTTFLDVRKCERISPQAGRPYPIFCACLNEKERLLRPPEGVVVGASTRLADGAVSAVYCADHICGFPGQTQQLALHPQRPILSRFHALVLHTKKKCLPTGKQNLCSTRLTVDWPVLINP